MAPIKRLAQSLVAAQGRPRPAGEHAKALVQSLAHTGSTQQRNPRCGQFNGQWQAVESTADFRDIGGVLRR